MANTLKIKRGTAATIPNGALAEPLFTSDTYDLYIGKGDGTNQRFQKYIASGTSSQFLKGDGSLDSNTYQTALTFSSPLVNTSGTISIPAATSSVNGYLTSTDWTTFNSKEPAITAGTTLQYYRGDKTFQTLDTAAVPENGAIYFTEPRVRATVLTGLNLSGGGTISASDSILTAFGKVQNQISALVGGATYQGTWNANTNTPSLASGVGTKGYYYVVSVAGSTNLDGITDWKVGDWAIFNGTTWDKVDNTDAVSSVNGFTGAVNLALDNISDVSAASPTNAQLLRFNGTSSLWENWTPTFEPALTKGNLTETTSSVLTITGGTGAVIGSGTTIEVASAGASQAGVVTTSAQTFAGVKTFSSTPVVPALHLADMTAGTGALYYNTAAKRLTLANYNADGILVFEVNGGNYAMYLNADLTMRLPGYTTNGFVKFSGGNGTISVDTNTYLTGNQTITLSGDISGSGTTAITTTIGALKVTNAMLAGSIDYAKMDSATVPTWNQNTTGNAATATKLATARDFTINGTAKSFDGSANVSWTAADIGLTSYLPLTGGTLTGGLSGTTGTFSGKVQGSAITLTDMTAGSGALYYNTTDKRLTLANYNADGLLIFEVNGGNFAMAINADKSIRMHGYTTNGFVKFSNSDGTLAVDTNTYLTTSSAASTYLPLAGGTLTGSLTISTSSSPSLNISKDASVDNRYIRFTNTQASSKNWDIINRPNANGNELAFYNDTDAIFALRLASTGAATFSSSIETPSIIYSDTFQNYTGGTTALTIKTGGNQSLILQTNSTDRLTISGTGAATFSSSVTAGNIYSGSSIFSSSSSSNIVQVGNNGVLQNVVGNQMMIANNAYYSGTTWLRINTATAQAIRFGSQIAGDISFHSAASGSAGSTITNWDGSDIRMYINPSGNVGIGTTSPTFALDVASTSADSFRINRTGVAGTGSASSMSFQVTQTNAQSATLASISAEFVSDWGGDLRFYTKPANGTPNDSVTERMRITSGGDVGIGGTPVSGQRLNVFNTVDFDIKLRKLADGGTVGILFETANNFSGTSQAYIKGIGSGSSGLSDLVFGTAGTTGATTASERMRITSGGNVGIGTASPSAYGHGGTNIITEIQNSGTAANSQAHLILSTGASTNTGAIGSITFALPNSSATNKRGAVIGSDITSNSSSAVYANLNFATSDGSGAATRMILTSGGELLINTTTDSGAYYLQVNGSVYATAYYESSDIRLKDVLTNSYSENFSAIEFMWKDKRDDKKHWGYAAQDVMKYIPDAIEVNNDGMMTVNYNEAHTWKIAQLEAKIVELEAKIK